ncbi:RINT1-like protein [Drosophila grimshawi]|uniref:GH15969 n=1 Tax=Drosophila grimshawi TaxID=7222 RepID=B4J1Z5_DROGR|nr:RINT1-like protein [Drosophila grimshawi]EDV95920.1 GH15969 [Drosophila grimshawi]
MHAKLSEMEMRVAARLNETLGKDANQLHRAAFLVESYKQELKSINQTLNYEEPQNVSSYKSALNCQQQVCESIDFELAKLAQFREKLESKLEDCQPALQGIAEDLQQVRQLQNVTQYLRLVQDIQEISTALSQSINGKDEEKLVNLYLTLYEGNDCEHSVVGRLQAVQARSLKSYAETTAIYWHKLLLQRLSSEFEAVLKAMRWAHLEQQPLNYSPSRDTAKAQLLAEYIFLIKSPAEERAPLQRITPSIACPPISQVVQLLLAPYRQRFMFHFMGTRQTNRLDKPEWFYTQIINWGKQTHFLVGKTFQPAAMKAGKLDYNLRLEFMRGLVQLTIEKLAADIEQIAQDDHLFAHLLDETLAFEADLRETFGYPASFPSAISVLTQPMYLLKWIALEEKFCAEKMDHILQAEAPFLLIDPNTYEDDLKIPRCADQFMRLLEAIKDRYYALIQPGHQLQFLSLQLELIDSFRRRLVQLHNSDAVTSLPVLNAFNYLIMVLREWGENVHYLHLHAALAGPNASEINSVFEHPVAELEHWARQLMGNLVNKAVYVMKAKSMNYRHDAWASMPEQNNREPFILSPSGGEMFQVLVMVLHNLESELSANLFNQTLRLMAQQIDDYMLESMVLNTRFAPAGAAQFNYDMTLLFALFGQYTRRPELLFKRIHDACKLLTAARGTALLLLETLRSVDTSVEEKTKPLHELRVLSLDSRQCIEVLERRTDIKIYF